MRKLHLLVVVVIVVAFAAASALAAEKESNVTGSWKCTGKTSDQNMQFQLDLVQKGNDVSGNASNDEGSVEIQKGTLENGKLKLMFDAMGGEYTLEATLDGDKLVNGNFKHTSGTSGTWEGSREGAAAPASASDDIVGSWKIHTTGGESAGDYTMEFKREDGKLTGVVYTPEGDTVPMTKASFEGGVLKFVVSAPGGDYEGEGSVTGKTIKGSYKTPDGTTGSFEGSRA